MYLFVHSQQSMGFLNCHTTLETIAYLCVVVSVIVIQLQYSCKGAQLIMASWLQIYDSYITHIMQSNMPNYSCRPHDPPEMVSCVVVIPVDIKPIRLM